MTAILFETFTDDCTYHTETFVAVCDTEETALEAVKAKFRRTDPMVDACKNIDEINEVMADRNGMRGRWKRQFLIRDAEYCIAPEQAAKARRRRPRS